ncbi:hypothetical protein BGZ67_009220, partial [Mortierella alpina]
MAKRVAQLSTCRPMSGADLLILQQSSSSISSPSRVFLFFCQTRELTSHEQEEFVKIKELLVPALLRYAQPTTAAASSSAPHVNPSMDTPAGRLLPPKTTSSRQLTLQEHRPRITPTLTQTRIKPERPQPQRFTSRPRPLGPSTFQNMEGAAPSSSSKKGPRKRLEIYQDDENAQPKRRRVKGCKDQGGDSDKENRNPADASSVNRTKRVLGEITNMVKNPPANQSRKGKSVLNSGAAAGKTSLQPKYPSDTTQRVKDANNTTVDTAKVDAQEYAEVETINHPVPKAAKANALAIDSTLVSTPIAIKGHKSTQTAEEETKVVIDQRLEVSSGLANNEKDTPTPALAYFSDPGGQGGEWGPDFAIPETRRIYSRERVTVRGARNIEVPGSVEDQQSATSFESNIKQARKTLALNSPRANTSASRASDQPGYEEVQDSQESPASQDTLSIHGSLVPKSPSLEEVQVLQNTPSFRGSLEPTLSLPEFLLNHEYEEVPDSQESHSLQDVFLCSQDPTLPQPGFLLGYDTDEEESVNGHIGDEANEIAHPRPVLIARSIAVESKPGAISRESHLAVESTHFADGIWCIDDCRQEVVSI